MILDLGGEDLGALASLGRSWPIWILVHKDSFNLQSHKTKHLVQHLRRLLGHRCHSALLVHEGNLDINDNCRSWVKPAWDRVAGCGAKTGFEFLGCHLAALGQSINYTSPSPPLLYG